MNNSRADPCILSVCIYKDAPNLCQFIVGVASEFVIRCLLCVEGLAFRRGTHDLYSASFDRTVKVWNISESGIFYVETLYAISFHILTTLNLDF